MKKVLRFFVLFIFAWFVAAIPSSFAVISLPEKSVWIAFVLHGIILLLSLYFMIKKQFLKKLED